MRHWTRRSNRSSIATSSSNRRASMPSPATRIRNPRSCCAAFSRASCDCRRKPDGWSGLGMHGSRFDIVDALNGEVARRGQETHVETNLASTTSCAAGFARRLATLELGNPDPEVRLAAVQAMLDRPNPDNAAVPARRSDRRTGQARSHRHAAGDRSRRTEQSRRRDPISRGRLGQGEPGTGRTKRA